MQGGGCLIIALRSRIAQKDQPFRQGSYRMGINSESDIAANLQIGPTTAGMVRIYVAGDGVDLPLDFDPEEAEEIADELRSAAQSARKMTQSAKGKSR
jgi:phage tail sheath gpL-like